MKNQNSPDKVHHCMPKHRPYTCLSTKKTDQRQVSPLLSLLFQWVKGHLDSTLSKAIHIDDWNKCSDLQCHLRRLCDAVLASPRGETQSIPCHWSALPALCLLNLNCVQETCTETGAFPPIVSAEDPENQVAIQNPRHRGFLHSQHDHLVHTMLMTHQVKWRTNHGRMPEERIPSSSFMVNCQIKSALTEARASASKTLSRSP